jgi:alpha-tubulin suppressor-like RCC1 family protein
LAGYGINYCALLNSGSVKCWGWSGYLYDTNISRGIVPVEIKGIGSGVRSIIANEYRACALYDNGTVKCWGVYSKSQFIGSTYYPNYTPTLLPGFTDIISFGDTTSNDICGISSKGKVICYENPKVTDLFTNPVVHLAAMYSMLCGVSESGAIECWKINNWYDESAINYEPVDMPGLESGVRNVYSGPTHMCAVLSNNVVKCWGENKFGQLGDGTGRNSDIPVAVRWK